MIHILSESGHERNRNAGDEAYFAAMVDLFRKQFDNVTIMAFSDRPGHDRRRYGVEAVYSGGTIGKTLSSLGEVWRAISACDVYVWGAGQILRDDTHVLAPAYRLWRPMLAQLLGKPVMAYAVGIGPLETRKARLLARLVLKHFDLVTYRDHATGVILQAVGIRGPQVIPTVDPAFALRPASKKAVDELLGQLGFDPERHPPLMGVAAYGPAYRGKFRGLRSLLPASLQARRNIWSPGAKEKYDYHVRLLAKAYDHMAEAHGLNLIFVVQDASGQGLDERITDDVISSMRYADSTVCLMADEHSPALLKGLMGRMEMVSGGRMHSLILASGQHTPIQATCYEEKIKAFGTVIGLEQHFIDVYSICDPAPLIVSLERVWRERRQIRCLLKERMKGLQSIVDENTKRLERLVGKGCNSDC